MVSGWLTKYLKPITVMEIAVMMNLVGALLYFFANEWGLWALITGRTCLGFGSGACASVRRSVCAGVQNSSVMLCRCVERFTHRCSPRHVEGAAHSVHFDPGRVSVHRLLRDVCDWLGTRLREHHCARLRTGRSHRPGLLPCPCQRGADVVLALGIAAAHPRSR